MRRTNEEFGRRVREVLDAHGAGGQPMSYRAADRRTGVNYATIGNMTMGQVPEMESVIKFAQGFGEDVNAWLELAGYPVLWDPDRAFVAGLRAIREDGYRVRLDSEEDPLSWSTQDEVKEALRRVRERAGCTCPSP